MVSANAGQEVNFQLTTLKLIGNLRGALNLLPSVDLDVLGDVLIQGDLKAGNIMGNLLANIVGDLIGNVIGNLDGDVVGNVVGNLTGDVCGNVFVDFLFEKTSGSGINVDGVVLKDAAVNADLTGNVTGNLTGDVSGDLTGNVDGDLVGNVTGNLTGDVSGDLVGNVTGNLTGDVCGNLNTDFIFEKTGGNGVNIDGVLLKDANITGTLLGNVIAGGLQVVGFRQSAIGTLTAGVGTANGTIALVSGSGADTTINDNFEDLAAKVNAIIAALSASSGHGLTAD